MFRWFAAAIVTLSLSGAAAWANPHSIGTSPVGSSDHVAALALVKYATERFGIDLRLVPQRSSAQVLPLVSSGQVELGLAGAPEIAMALSGEGFFEKNAQENIVAIGNIYPFRLVLVAQRDSRQDTAAGFAGMRIPHGFFATSVGDLYMKTFLAVVGLDQDDMRKVNVGTFNDSREAFMGRRADVAPYVIGTPVWDELTRSVGPIEILNLAPKGEGENPPPGMNPFFRLVPIEVAAPYYSDDDPYYVLEYDYLVYTHKDAPDELVEQIATALAEGAQQMAQSVRAFNDYDASRVGLSPGIPFHPAALRVYRSKNLPTSEE